MSPRKSSTSSAEPSSFRSRYLGIEVAGLYPVPPKWLERTLAQGLAHALGEGAPVRLIRVRGARALVEIGHHHSAAAREAWNASFAGPDGTSVSVTTRRTWGTLLKGKEWMKRAGNARPPEGNAGDPS
ncbi:MAG TPA: hypothetical protein VFF67_00195 [Thermoplasmata archaeon]|nr:hypothetical protein [Thermoplasmata archaeon]